MLSNQSFNIPLAWTRSKLESSRRRRSQPLTPRSTATGLQFTLNLVESSGISCLIDGNDSPSSGSPAVSHVGIDSFSVASFSDTPSETWMGLGNASRSESFRCALAPVSCDVSSMLRGGSVPSLSCAGSFVSQYLQFEQGWARRRGSGTTCSVEPV